MIAAPPAELTSIQQQRTKAGFRRIFILFFIVAGLGILCHLGILLWAQNGFTGPEAVVAAQSMMLASDGTLYYDLNRYPYTSCAYMPLLYNLEAGLSKLGLPAYQAGRLVSFLAMLAVFVLSWRIVLLYTGDRYCAWTAALLSASSALLLSWGTVGQVDTLAAMFALAAFYKYSRYAILGENTLPWAASLALLAFFTKQTMLACPAAIFVLLWFHHRKTALQFGAGLAAAAAVLVLAINAAMSGRFLESTVLANMNPYALHKLGQHLKFAVLSAGPLMLIAMTGAGAVLGAAGRALYVYLGFAFFLFILLAPKEGSDLNYQIEFTILLILCAAVALHELNFFGLLFQRARGQGAGSWITLLQIPMVLFLIVNYGIRLQNLVVRVGAEQLARREIELLRPLLLNGGRVISADYNVMVRLRGRIDVETLIYAWLVNAGRVNPEPVRRDIAAAKFSSIILMEDVNRRDPNRNIELSTLPDSQIEEIRRRYRLVQRNPMGVYVYQPIRPGADSSLPPKLPMIR